MPSDKFSKLTWLKRTNGHKFTGAEFRVLVSIYNHSTGEGKKSHPGIDLMVEETGYRKSGISEAVTALKARGWIHETYKGNGRAKLSSEFELVPDAPNPSYRCPPERARSCSTCSNSSAQAEPLGGLNGSAVPEPLAQQFRSTGTHSSAQAEPIGPLQRSPSDPLSDPDNRSGSGTDPEEVRYSPNHLGDQDETGLESRSLAVEGRTEATPTAIADGRGQDGPSLEPATATEGATGAPEGLVGLQPPTDGSRSDDPWADMDAWRAEFKAREERDARAEAAARERHVALAAAETPWPDSPWPS